MSCRKLARDGEFLFPKIRLLMRVRKMSATHVFARGGLQDINRGLTSRSFTVAGSSLSALHSSALRTY